MALSIGPYNMSNTLVGSNINGSPVALTANTWTRISVTFTPAATVDHVWLFSYLTTGTWNGSQTYDVTGVMLHRGAAAVDYFDGSTTDSTYSYLWTGTEHASQSVRVGPHNADSTVWEPGQTAWDWLSPLLNAGNLRLFCDEQRRWYLVDPTTFTVNGAVIISEGTNAVRGTDTISLQATRGDGSPVWYSGVVVKWTGTDGAATPVYETAGTTQKVYKIEIQRPYPGAGYAASVLARAQGRGRTQDVEALADLSATPGMQVAVAMPGVPTQSGVVSSVTWRWSADSDDHDRMSVTTRGLIDTADTAWLLGAGTWNSQSDTWTSYDG